VQHISRTLWLSLFAVFALILLAWIALSQNGRDLPAKVLESIAAGANSFEQSLAPKPTAAPSKSTLIQPASALPQTITYYRWTDNQGQTGYSADLPEDVSSFKAIVLDRRAGPSAQPTYPYGPLLRIRLPLRLP
jgi:hypothetical protein